MTAFVKSRSAVTVPSQRPRYVLPVVPGSPTKLLRVRLAHKAGFFILFAAMLVLALSAVSIAFGFAPGSHGSASGQTLKGDVSVEFSKPSDGFACLSDSGLSVNTTLIALTNAGAEPVPGKYSFPLSSDDRLVASAMFAPRLASSLTVPAGLRIDEVAGLVETATDGAIARDDFIATASSVEPYSDEFPFLSDVKSLEGYLAPGMYALRDGDDAQGLVKRMLQERSRMDKAVDWSWVDSKSGNITRADCVVVASLLEMEAAPEDRADLASYYYNRLEAGWQLQSASAAAYPQCDGWGYDSFSDFGLPPWPVCSPSLESLAAAAHPTDSDYLYHTDGDGRLSFSAAFLK